MSLHGRKDEPSPSAAPNSVGAPDASRVTVHLDEGVFRFMSVAARGSPAVSPQSYACGRERGLVVHDILYPEWRTRMATKINIVLDDDVKAELDQMVESGLRSRVINEALRKELLLLRRRQLSARLDKLRVRTKPVSTREVVTLIRRDRGR